MSRMTDKEWDDQKDRVLTLAGRITNEIGLGFWKVKYHWHDSEPPSDHPKIEGSHAIAVIYVQWHYCQLEISFNLDATRRLDDDDLLYVVNHELCHALVNEMRERDNDRKHEERVVDGIAKALIWTAEAAEARGYERAKREFADSLVRKMEEAEQKGYDRAKMEAAAVDYGEPSVMGSEVGEAPCEKRK